MSLITYTKNGLYCPRAQVYIDPHKKVDNAMITHGHGDHAKWGHRYYVCAQSSVNILKHRLGHSISIRGMGYGASMSINGVKFSFHPAGHILGSAQIRIEYKGEIWVISGDYKLEDDGISTPFESIKCHHFITECTFGMPKYKWPDQKEIISDINGWWAHNANQDRPSVIAAYALGKAQRILYNIDNTIGPIYTFEGIEKMNAVYRIEGVNLPSTRSLNRKSKITNLKKALVVVPPRMLKKGVKNTIEDCSIGVASGWMIDENRIIEKGGDEGFVLSDHCDWDGLNTAIKETGATHVYTMHGYTESFTEWLNDQGYFSKSVKELKV